MFFLEQQNRIVADTVRNFIKNKQPAPAEEKEEEEVFDSHVYDMDDATIFISAKTSAVSVSIKVPYFSIIKDKGAMEKLQSVYGDFIQATPAEGYDVTVTVTREQWTGKEDEIVQKLSLIRRHVVAGVFEKYLRANREGKVSELGPIEYRSTDDTLVTFTPQERQFTVTYALEFIDKADRELARVFLTSFANASRKAPRAPVMNFKADTIPEKPNYIGTFTFIVNPYSGEDRVISTVADLVSSFRNFLHYHIKASKTYFQSRMRNRVVDLVKILNRAKQA